MGHRVAKDAYRELGRTIDGLNVRAPWSETLGAILRELYTEEEADLVSRMPTGLAPLRRIAKVTGKPEKKLAGMLGGLAGKGLVFDTEIAGEWRYAISPFVIGVFEYTMMRSDGGVDFPRAARLFKDYLAARGGFIEANAGQGEQVSVMRTLPHAEAIADQPHIEVLDHEKAEEMVERSQSFAPAPAPAGTRSCTSGRSSATPPSRCASASAGGHPGSPGTGSAGTSRSRRRGSCCPWPGRSAWS